jgi:hypothetical protein
MPNDCWNHMTITGNKSDIAKLIASEFLIVPSWCLQFIKKREEGVIFKLWSPWKPDFPWLESLIDKYPSCWVKDEWNEEGGMAGVWVGTAREGVRDIKELSWRDLCLEEECYIFRNEN